MKDFKKYLMSKSIVSKKASLLFELGCSAYRYLAKTTGPSISISITYILFVTKLQKRQILEKDLPLLKNDITGSEPAVKILDTLQVSAIGLICD